MINDKHKLIQVVTVKNNPGCSTSLTITPTRAGSTIIAYEVYEESNLEYLERKYDESNSL